MEEADKDQRWADRTAASYVLRAIVLIGPFASSFLFASVLTELTPTPSSMWTIIARWLAIAAASTVVLVIVERQLRRLLPLVALLRLSLPFPERAPSRLRLALRTNSEKHLQKRIRDAREGRLGNDASEHAITILELVAALNMHDQLTRGHSERVRAYSRMIGKQMGLDREELDRLAWAGLLHDIGKLLVPTEVLNKPGKLTDDEFDLIKQHPEYGRGLVEPLTPWLGDAARAVWEHHERWSGGGYPRGIAGADIAQAARIVSVADTFDVITSVRSYKDRTSPSEARAELARCSGSQFDPVVVKAFMDASIQRYGWMSTPAAWAAQTTFIPSGAIPALVRSGAVASGLTVSGLSSATGASAEVPQPPQPAIVRIADIELGVIEPQSSITITTTAGNAPVVTLSNPVSERDPQNPSTPTSSTPSGEPDAFTPVSFDVMPSTGPGGDAMRPMTTMPGTPTTDPSTARPPTTSRPGTPSTTAPPATVTSTVRPPMTVPRPPAPPSPSNPTTPTLPATTPATTMPVTMQPATTVPLATMPPATMPATPPVTMPPVTMPPVTMPPVTVPPVTVPPMTVPRITMPPVTLPLVVLPPITMPQVVTLPPVVPLPPPDTPIVTLPPLFGG